VVQDGWIVKTSWEIRKTDCKKKGCLTLISYVAKYNNGGGTTGDQVSSKDKKDTK